jgi:dTDP-4-dehydrorhamnose reductase
MSKPIILVTGANGQLGKELQVLAEFHDNYSFVFTTREELPIQEADKVKQFFAKHKPAWCINCAAYTAVDKAESDRETAFAVNADATGTLAAASKKQQSKFIHISTDYVFDGQSPVPYKEDAPTNPINTYGASKLKGEQLCLQQNPDAVIIRTAWVYSGFGHNFVKTMLRLMSERPLINVVNDQVGAPTYAADLARCIMHIIVNKKWVPGIYHYSNKGRISWYEFADAIKEFTHSNCTVNPIPSSQYPTPAKRPSFSLLDTHKIFETYHCEIPEWKDGLERCLQKLII